jgi:MoxR-like ATPase
MSTTQTAKPEIHPVLHGRDILWIQQLVRQVPASQHMVDYAVDLARATRPKEPPSPDFVKNWLAWGAGPRAAQYMTLGAKSLAIMHGRFAVTAEDIRRMAYPVLRHRLFTNFNADAEGVDVDQVIEKILETTPEPSYGEATGARARVKRAASAGGEAPSRPAGTPPGAIPATRPGAAAVGGGATGPVSPSAPAGSPAASSNPPPRTPPERRPMGPTPPPGGPTPPPR